MVKEFWRSVRIWQSYGKKLSGTFFSRTRCIYQCEAGCVIECAAEIGRVKVEANGYMSAQQFSVTSLYVVDLTDLYMYILHAVHSIHVEYNSNHVASDKLTTQKWRNVYKLSWLGWASLSSQSHERTCVTFCVFLYAIIPIKSMFYI